MADFPANGEISRLDHSCRSVPSDRSFFAMYHDAATLAFAQTAVIKSMSRKHGSPRRKNAPIARQPPQTMAQIPQNR